MKNLRVWIAALVTSFMLMPQAPALSIEPQKKSYEINGASIEELNSQIIVMLQDKGLDASWEIKWRYTDFELASGCVADMIAVDLKMNTPTPKWLDAELASEELRRKWEHFLNALNMHHAGHKDIANLAVRKIKQAIQAMQAKDCAQLRKNVDAMANGVIGDFKQRDAEYDILTENGELQGVDANLLK